MAARSFLYGGSGGSGFNSALLTNKRPPLDSFFVGSRSMVSFEDAGNRSGKPFFQTFNQDENGDDDYDDYFHHPEKKRRLKADQVEFLEKSFETENKLEPERKIQLAKELGLQPRQIAIWFQNRRARWKTKQLEKDYDVLQESYNELKANYDNLLQEKEQLKSQVVDLSEKLLIQETEKGGCDSSSSKSPSEALILQLQEGGLNDEDVSKTSNVNVFEQEESDDQSLEEEDELEKMFVNGYMLPKVETGDYQHHQLDAVNSCYLDQDQSFGFWPY